MIRHTHVGVPKGTCYGWSDVPLADTFESEAMQTSKNLKEILSDGITPDVIYSSPLSRAIKLSAYCGYDTPVKDDRLKEMNMGDWEMQKYADVRCYYVVGRL